MTLEQGKVSASKQVDENYSKAKGMIFENVPELPERIHFIKQTGWLKRNLYKLTNPHRLNSINLLRARIEEARAFYYVRLTVEASINPHYLPDNAEKSAILKYLELNVKKDEKSEIGDDKLNVKKDEKSEISDDTFSHLVQSKIVDIDPVTVKLDPERTRRRTALLVCYYSVELAALKLECCDFESAWSYYYMSERSLLRLDWRENEALDSNYLRIVAESIWAEANAKLEPWKKEKVQKLLFDEKTPKPTYTIEEIVQAKRIIDSHDHNVEYKANSVHWQLDVLGTLTMILLIIAVFVLTTSDLTATLRNLSMLIMICVFGAFGGSISGIFSLSKISMKETAEIPIQSLSGWLTISRPLVGAVSALIIAVFILSGLMDVGTISPTVILAVSFVSGFSERLILGAADKIP
ncbi:MAG TPA: hypothetical protein VGK23_09930 [Methanomassiliicoccales archaeon]|jgi:hypothetical protein